MSNIDPSFEDIARSGNVPIIGQGQQDPGNPRPRSLGEGRCYEVIVGFCGPGHVTVYVPDPKKYEPCDVLMGLGNVQLPFAFRYEHNKLIVNRNWTLVSVPVSIIVVDEPPWWDFVEKWWHAHLQAKGK